MAVSLKSTHRWAALTCGVMLLMPGCNGNGTATLPPPEEPPIVPPGMGEDSPWRINHLAIPEWYTTLSTQPVAEIDGEVATWSWEFGAGATPSTSTEQQPTITLQAPGDYTAILTITDSAGHTGRLPFAYRVLPPTLPTIESVTPDGEAGGEFTMSTFGVTTSGPPVTSWSWDFGDGALPAQSTDVAPQVELQRIGGHTGTLEVCGPFGCSQKEFGYGIRAARPVWNNEVMNAFPTQLEMCLAPDGTVRLFYLEGDQLDMAILTNAGSAGPGVASIRHQFTVQKAGYVSGIDVVATPDAMFAVLEYGWFLEPTLIWMNYQGTDRLASDLEGFEPMFSRTDNPEYVTGFPLATDGETLYLGATRPLPDNRHEPGLLTFSPGRDFIFGGDFHVLAPPAEYPYPDLKLKAFALEEIDGTLYQAQSRRGGASITYATTLSVGRKVGDLSLGPAAWRMVDIDDRARGCPIVKWIPTSSGLQVLYGRFDSFSSYGLNDFALRMAWSANRDFESAIEWQSGFWEAGVQHFGLEIQPLHGSALVIQSAVRGLAFTRGYGAEPGNIPWQQERLTLGAGVNVLQQIVSAGDDGGQWIAAIDYQTIGGSIEHGTYPTDPQLLLGHLSWE